MHRKTLFVLAGPSFFLHLDVLSFAFISVTLTNLLSHKIIQRRVLTHREMIFRIVILAASLSLSLAPSHHFFHNYRLGMCVRIGFNVTHTYEYNGVMF